MHPRSPLTAAHAHRGRSTRPRSAATPMNAFDAWLIVVGLAIGAGLAWLVMLDLRRREDDIAAREMRSEAAWIADTLRSRDVAADPEAVEEVLRLHRAYLAGIPDERAAPPPTGPPGTRARTTTRTTRRSSSEVVAAPLAPATAAPPPAAAPAIPPCRRGALS